ncbi:MAG TPA: sporulation integral membrane protein YtvI [Candidatus Choladocola avistercoris]|nr:sporulation integral membrane protein YtvI [Candidatus Choladocola avistercoris]
MNIETQKRFLIRIGFWAVVILLVILCLKYVLPFLLPFVVAFLIAALLNKPIMLLAEKLNGKRVVPAILMTLLFYVAAAALFSLLGLRVFMFVWETVRALPQLYRNTLEPALETMFSSLEVYLDELDPAVVTALTDNMNSALGSLGSFVTNASVRIISYISGIAAAVPGSFLNVIITIIVTFFLAIDYPKVTGFILRQLPEKADFYIGEVRDYVGGTLLKCLASYALILCITFLEISVGLTVLRVPNAILIALCIAVFDILPVLGTGGIMIPWGIISLIMGKWVLGLGLLALYLIITVIRNIIEPKIVGHQVGLHPVVTLLSMLAGLQLFGIIGLFGFPITLSLLKNLNDRGVIHILK